MHTRPRARDGLRPAPTSFGQDLRLSSLQGRRRRVEVHFVLPTSFLISIIFPNIIDKCELGMLSKITDDVGRSSRQA